MQTIDYKEILSHFHMEGTVSEVKPLGNGLINDTLKVNTTESDKPDYVLQRINNAIFTDVEMLQHNIQVVTTHIRHKLEQQGASDIDRKVLHFLEAENGKTYYKDAQDRYWRVMVFIPGAKTYEAVTPEYSYYAGVAFGDFEKMLVDVPEQLGETIPNFHNLELRLQQLRDVVAADPVGRVKEEKVQEMLGFIEAHADEMCKAERLHREGKLPKRICHCDTKVNNMMFDENGHILCVIDLDTVMPSYIFSDYGDFLRSAANTTAEDDPDLSHVAFNEEIFKAFTKGYLESAGDFLTPVERENLPYAVALFPFMQSVRFLWDYISGDHYWKCKYPEHNLDRARNQLQLYKEVRAHDQMMQAFVG
jgi:Ser/Thr protein kinase RdoA (MazF antagonist)